MARYTLKRPDERAAVYIGRVTRSVVVPTKHPGLTRAKLLLVYVAAREGDLAGRMLLSVDTVGAGVGDQVVLAVGSHALGLVVPEVPADAAVVGIIAPPIDHTADMNDHHAYVGDCANRRQPAVATNEEMSE